VSTTTRTISVKGSQITISRKEQDDYLSLTDIARYRDAERTDYIIQNWLRNRNTIEFLGIWEQLYNPGFNPIEFDGFKKQAGLNSFVLTAKRWIEKNGAIGLVPPLPPALPRCSRCNNDFARRQNIQLDRASPALIKYAIL